MAGVMFKIFLYISKTTTKRLIMEKFVVGDYLYSTRFGWQYKIVSLRNGVAVLQDLVRENVRVRFTILALHNRIKFNSFVHSPHPF